MSFSDNDISKAEEFKPRVSIVIPVYNGSDFLAESIQSAINQTYDNVEVIVVNDGSNDNGATECIARSFGDAVLYFSKVNGGVASALNFAIERMTGEYFSWLSHDDIYAEDKIARQIAFLAERDPKQTIVYSDYFIFTGVETNKVVRINMPMVQHECFRYWITSQSALHGCTLLIPRAAFDVAGSFDEELRTTQDYELWFRMAGIYQFHHLPEALVSARSHANQDTNRMADVAFAEAGDLYLGFVKSMIPSDIPGKSSSEIGVCYLRLASSLWQRGFNDAAAYSGRMARQYGISFIEVLGSQLIAVCAKSLRWSARAMLTPQSRQAIRKAITSLTSFHRNR